MSRLVALALFGCGPALAARFEERRHQDLLQEMDMLRSEVERLRGRVRVLEYEKEAGAQGEAAAAAGAEARGPAGRLLRQRSSLAGVANALMAAPGPNQSAPDIWAIAGPEGGSDKYTEWRAEKGGGAGAWCCAILFIGVFGAAPIVPHIGAGAAAFTRVHIIESLCLYVWLIVGMCLFTQYIEFQSPHFAEVRTLCIEEAVYLVAQIVTTVGYGDITPAHPYGQVFVGCFVFMAIMLAGQMITVLTQTCEKRIDELLVRASEQSEQLLRSFSTASSDGAEEMKNQTNKRRQRAVWVAAKPMINSAMFFSLFCVFGATFYVIFPGENKTPLQAVYMALITLSTVGFGAFTPTTHGGMVFGAFWMLFGVASLASLVSSRAAFAAALEKYDLAALEDEMDEREVAVEEEARAGDKPGKVQETKFEQKAQDAGGSLHAESEVMVCPHCGHPSAIPKEGQREGAGAAGPKLRGHEQAV